MRHGGELGPAARAEEALRDHPWLVGDQFTLADFSMTPYVNRFDRLGMAEMWTASRPRLADWFERIEALPTFKPCW